MSLRELRQKRGLTQQQLADKVPGMTRGRIAAYETGANDVSNMSLGMACRFADALKVANPRKLLEAERPKESTSES